MIPALEEESGEWNSAFEYASPTRANPADTTTPTDRFTTEDVVEVVALNIEYGDYAETDVKIVGRLSDGRWFALEAGCDTTGWDCQAGGSSVVASTLKEILALGIDDHTATRLGLTEQRAQATK